VEVALMLLPSGLLGAGATHQRDLRPVPVQAEVGLALGSLDGRMNRDLASKPQE
jgi:hypothetical protein